MPIDHRRSARYQFEAPAILRVHGRPGPFLVTILDVSASGLRLSSNTAFHSGTRVTITCRGANVSGEIRYTREVEGSGFNLGFQADEASAGAMSESGEMDLTRIFSTKKR